MSTALVRASGASSAPKRSTKKFKYNMEVLVIVGEEKKGFMMHKDVLTFKSPFFRNACARAFREPGERKIELPEADPETFQCYMQWAYRRQVVFSDADNDEDDEDASGCLDSLSRLYTLAELVRNIPLKNAVVDKFISVLSSKVESPSVNSIVHLWERSAVNCQLRRVILDWVLFYPKGERLEELRGSLPSGFLADLGIEFAMAKWDIRRITDPLTAQRTHYHEQDSNSTYSAIDEIDRSLAATQLGSD